MEWYKLALSKWKDFDGRSRRKEYWMFTLFNLIFIIAASIIDRVTGLANDLTGIGPVYVIYVVAMFIPAMAVAIRRLHDIGKSGWWLLLAILPVIGGLWLLFLLVQDSQPGDNQYGPNPKASVAI